MRSLTVGTPRVVGNRHEIDVAGSTLWYEFDGPLIPERAQVSAAAVALLPYAMARFDALHVAGDIDRDLLANLEEFRDYWSMWLPGRLKSIEISANRLVGKPPGARAAVAAFSGGVDSTYQLVANVEQLLGARSLPVRAAVLIHGFDVPVDDADGFRRAVSHARPVLDELGVALVTVRTSWREFCPDWEMCFAAGVASVLHHFADTVGYGLVAPDEQYDLEVLPWGSNSTSNPLLGGGAFRIRSDGAGVSRTAKSAVIGHHDVVLQHVRVCWAGATKGENCGLCEKCIRTRLNFVAAGFPEVTALGGVVTAREVARVRTNTRAQNAYLRDIVRDGLPSGLARAVRQAIRTNEIRKRLSLVQRVWRSAKARAKRRPGPTRVTYSDRGK